jgi:iron-sulfur cluster repair protein YtfE (RIC family)
MTKSLLWLRNQELCAGHPQLPGTPLSRGTYMQNPVILPDDSTRPKAPKIADATEYHRRSGQRLAQFHAMHLRELSRVHRAMEQVFAGHGTADKLLTTISSMQMISNMRQFGNLCGAACEILTGHHSIEDYYVFPRLKGHTPALDKVVERLKAEHLVIHDLIVRLENAAHSLINTPGTESATALRAAFRQLETFVTSHFGYEQTELEEALGYYGVDI